MNRHAFPDFHATLLDPASYPDAPRRVRCEETRRSWLYRTGSQVYKIRKTSTLYSSPAVKERYAQLALSLGRRWAGEVPQAVVPLVRHEGAFALGGAGEPVDYALCMAQLPDAHWLERLLAQGRLTGAGVGRLARFVAERHAAAALDEKAAEAGHPEQVQALLDELTYQSRKFFGQSVSEPILEMIARPLARYLEEHRRLLLRRLKRGRIVDGHGALLPEHIHAHGSDLHALSPLEAQPKYRRLDAANDVAVLVNALALREAGELAELFVKRYAAAARDRDLPRVLPLYRILQALRGGLAKSQWAAECPPEAKERQVLMREASTSYNHALQIARELPRLP
jgi:uncharacterized protein